MKSLDNALEKSERDLALLTKIREHLTEYRDLYTLVSTLPTITVSELEKLDFLTVDSNFSETKELEAFLAKIDEGMVILADLVMKHLGGMDSWKTTTHKGEIR